MYIQMREARLTFVLRLFAKIYNFHTANTLTATTQNQGHSFVRGIPDHMKLINSRNDILEANMLIEGCRLRPSERSCTCDVQNLLVVISE